MPKLTVFLIRNGETLLETEEQDEPLRRSEKVDPALTDAGYKQSQKVALQLVDELCEATPIPETRGDSDGDGVIDPLRNLAVFSAPLKACQGTALLLTAAGMASQDKLTFRYTTIEAAQSPSAVPVITVNELAKTPLIDDCGGMETTVNAGLLHTAAAPWNDGRNKCPFGRVLTQEFKRDTEFVKVWKEDRHVHPPRRVLAVQYLRLTDDGDPWSLEALTPKTNISVDMLEPNKYLTPPRKGILKPKLRGEDARPPEATSVDVVTNCVYKARQVGCDTVLFTVPSIILEDMMKETGEDGAAIIQPCSVLTLLATINDETQSVDDWELVDLNTTPTVPNFPGPVDCIVQPPPEKDPSTVPANQWSRFPPPEPEVIPPDYPDLPPFGMALSHPPPKVDLTPEEMAPRRTPQPTRPVGGPGPMSRGGGGRGRVPAGRGRGRGPGRIPSSSTAGRTRLPTGRAPTFSPGRVPSSPGRAPKSPGQAPASPGHTPVIPGRASMSPGRVASPGRSPMSPGRTVPASPGHAPIAPMSPGASASSGSSHASPSENSPPLQQQDAEESPKIGKSTESTCEDTVTKLPKSSKPKKKKTKKKKKASAGVALR